MRKLKSDLSTSPTEESFVSPRTLPRGYVFLINENNTVAGVSHDGTFLIRCNGSKVKGTSLRGLLQVAECFFFRDRGAHAVHAGPLG